MQKERPGKLPTTHPVNTSRMVVLRAKLEQEIKGYHSSSPTAYTQIKREFNITGSRKNVLRQITKLIEERLENHRSLL